MNEKISIKQFIKMRDSGKFSKKFQGKHSYFIYIDEEIKPKNKLRIHIDEYNYEVPEAPRKINQNILLNDFLDDKNV